MSFQFDDELYRDIILDHYRNPRNDGETVKSCTLAAGDAPSARLRPR